MITVLKKETAIYGVGRILGSSISFFLFPFYTHALQSTGEYGVVQIIIAFIAFTNIVFLFGFDGALMKYYVSSDSPLEKQKYSEIIRKKPQPILIEAKTFRIRGHEEASGIKYVPKALIQKWEDKDPIKWEKGYVFPSDKPGLEFELNEELAEK